MFRMPCSSYLDGFSDGGWWLYSCCFVGCCFQDLFNLYTKSWLSETSGQVYKLESSVSSNENDINMRLAKIWTAIDMLSIIWKSNLSDKIKSSFFLAVVVSILLYGCTTWTLTKRIEKKLGGNWTSSYVHCHYWIVLLVEARMSRRKGCWRKEIKMRQ